MGMICDRIHYVKRGRENSRPRQDVDKVNRLAER